MSERVPHRRSSRGASTTEFALALLLVVPCVLYGIHAGELFIVGAKAQEAEISAAWDVTAYRFHDYSVSATAAPAAVRARYDAVAAAVSANIDADLVDLNSYASSGRRGMSLIAGRAEFVGAAVSCRRRDLSNRYRGGGYLPSADLMPFRTLDFDNDTTWFPSRAPAQSQAARDTLTRDHLVTCQSRLQHTTLWIPTTWAPEFSNGEQLNPIVAPTVFGGLGSSLNGTRAGAGPSLGMAMLTDDWAVEDANRAASDEIAMRAAVSANPKFYRVGQRVHQMITPYIGDEQMNEDMQFLLGHRWMHGDARDTGEIDAYRLGLDTAFSRLTNLQIENPLDGNDGNRPWYLLPHRDGEKGHPSLEVVAGTRSGGNYLGHPSATFNRP